MAKAEKIPVDDFEVKLTLTKEETQQLLNIVGNHCSGGLSSIYAALIQIGLKCNRKYSVEGYIIRLDR